MIFLDYRGYIQAKDFKCGLENFVELQDSRPSTVVSGDRRVLHSTTNL